MSFRVGTSNKITLLFFFSFCSCYDFGFAWVNVHAPQKVRKEGGNWVEEGPFGFDRHVMMLLKTWHKAFLFSCDRTLSHGLDFNLYLSCFVFFLGFLYKTIILISDLVSLISLYLFFLYILKRTSRTATACCRLSHVHSSWWVIFI